MVMLPHYKHQTLLLVSSETLLKRTYLPKLGINVRVLKWKIPGPHELWLFLDQ